MKVAGVFVALALFSHFEGVASQMRYQEGMCREFQPFLEDGNLYCNRDIDPVFGPDGRRHMNKCVMCREVLRRRAIAGWPKNPSSAKAQNCTKIWYGLKEGLIAQTEIVNSPGRVLGCLPCLEHSKHVGKAANLEQRKRRTQSGNMDDDCSEYWPYFRDGSFSCTRENNPVRDASGKQHSNKCIMCLQKFKNGGTMNSVGKDQPQNGKNERNDGCDEYRSEMGPNGELTCTRENAPVRDATGYTYNNKCIMCSEKFKKEVREGRIVGGGKGGGGGGAVDTYGNRIVQGNFNPGNSNEKNCKPYGKNDVNNPCPAEYQIASGDYRSYTNCGGTGQSSYYNENCRKGPFRNRQKKIAVGDKKLDCDQILAAIKKEGTSCNALWSPVCGTDEKTYSNKCFLCSAIVKAEDTLALKNEGECQAGHIKADCNQYPQTRGKVLCKRRSQEVCGTDGETYGSECMLCDRILKTKSEIGCQKALGRKRDKEQVMEELAFRIKETAAFPSVAKPAFILYSRSYPISIVHGQQLCTTLHGDRVTDLDDPVIRRTLPFASLLSFILPTSMDAPEHFLTSTNLNEFLQ
ncbi:serine protease inhibitor Kazal-type 5-like isoform X2 [Podarcis lilfordi]|uniref:Serine protease inhibitor Kazal-type 5-like isoform X2 n=1 Tax=Podarcis lilfordi TaxID=74358 RepID=A0AA35NZM1_9SAUR|nr:serine protease inhibitor Kazal-type 5-like isoform X2 [Podarcis lilfordi]